MPDFAGFFCHEKTHSTCGSVKLDRQRMFWGIASRRACSKEQQPCMLERATAVHARKSNRRAELERATVYIVRNLKRGSTGNNVSDSKCIFWVERLGLTPSDPSGMCMITANHSWPCIREEPRPSMWLARGVHSANWQVGSQYPHLRLAESRTSAFFSSTTKWS